MREKLRIKTIREKIVLSIFIVIALCMVFSAFIVSQVVKDQLGEKYEVDKMAATESLSHSLAPVLDLYDYKQVELIITSSLTYENIAYISVFNKGGILVVSAAEQNVSAEDLDVEQHEMTSKDKVIGSIEVGFSKEYIDEQIQTTTIALLSGLAGFLILVGLALFAFINHSVISPLRVFTKTVREIGSENLSSRVNIDSEDEIGTLARSFNQMTEDLENSHDALQQRGEELDRTIFNLFALFEASRALGPPLDIQEILELAIDMFVELIRTERGLIMMVEEETGELVARAAKGLSEDFMAQAKLEIAEHETQQLLQLGGPVSLTDADSKLKDYCPALYQKLTQIGIELCIPLATRDKLIGLVALSKKETGAGFSAGDLEFLSTVAKQVVSSLENAQLVKTIRKWGEGLEKKVQERTQELEQKSQELASTNLSLEEASRAKSEFLANMSHELRTPLNSIIGYTKFMLDGLEGDINEEQQKDLHAVYTNSKHLLELINDLLDMAKIEAGKVEVSYQEFTISDLLAVVIPSVEQLAREKGLTLTYSVAPDIDNLYADKAKTRQVLINILGNAIKFTNEGSVKLNVAKTDSDFIFSVTDTGMGMKNEDLEAIFDSFKQVGPAQIAGYEGTGLGLAISKQFIEMQGGRIWAESEPGKGSTFTFTLPKKKVANS